MPDSIGEQLEAARVAQGLEIEDVAHKTRIHHDVLRQLEANEFDKMPNEMFAKSFLGLYGEHVGVDTGAAVANLEFESASNGEQFLLGGIKPEVRSRYGNLTTRIPVRPILASAAAVLALIMGGSYLVSHLYGADTGTTNNTEPVPEIGPSPSEEPIPETELAGAPDEVEIVEPSSIVPIGTPAPATEVTDSESIPKGEPVVRKAEPVDEESVAAEEENPEEELPTESTTVASEPYLVQGYIPSDETEDDE